MSSYLEIAISAVRGAGELAAAAFCAAQIVQVKHDGDPVTQTDIAVEQHVVSTLAKVFPDHGFIAEESGEHNADAEYVWILDPIDGTNYFWRGIPFYSISLALKRREQLVLGIVYVVETEQLFTASLGHGALLNGERIQCSSETALANSILCVEIPNRYAPDDVKQQALAKVARLMDACSRQRMIGVSTLGLCYCAMGGFDAYVNLSRWSKIWDVAAGKVILRESGASLTTTKNGDLIGGPAPLHDQLLELLE